MAGTAKVATKSNRGSKPGERRGGRQQGTPNKATAEIKDLARSYTTQALETLAQVMLAGESEAARVSAANALLDRGYGKPSTVIGGDPTAPLRLIVETGVARAAH